MDELQSDTLQDPVTGLFVPSASDDYFEILDLPSRIAKGTFIAVNSLPTWCNIDFVNVLSLWASNQVLSAIVLVDKGRLY